MDRADRADRVRPPRLRRAPGRADRTTTGRAGDAHADALADAIGLDAFVSPSCVGLPASCGPSANASCCGAASVTGGTFDRRLRRLGRRHVSEPGLPGSGLRLPPRHLRGHGPGASASSCAPASARRRTRRPRARARTRTSPAAGGSRAGTRTSRRPRARPGRPVLGCGRDVRDVDDQRGLGRQPADQLRDLVRGDGVLRVGRRLPADRGAMELCGGRRLRPGARMRGRARPALATVDCSYANYTPSAACAAEGPNRVGSESPKGDGKWGQADLTGNVFEWTLDWQAAYANPCTDCADLTQSAMRTLRGGDFGDPAINARNGYRGNAGTPGNRDSRRRLPVRAAMGWQIHHETGGKPTTNELANPPHRAGGPGPFDATRGGGHASSPRTAGISSTETCRNSPTSSVATRFTSCSRPRPRLAAEERTALPTLGCPRRRSRGTSRCSRKCSSSSACCVERLRRPARSPHAQALVRRRRPSVRPPPRPHGEASSGATICALGRLLENFVHR